MVHRDNLVYDIIVVGNGVAGIAAALYCLQQGKNTILIGEKKSIKNTIESIHPGVLSLLSHLKIDLDFSFAKLGTYSYISNGVEKKSLNPYTEEIWEGFHISKRDFTNHLKNEAKKQKLSIINETIENIILEKGRIVGVKTKTGVDFFSKYIIDASGSKRIIGKKMNFKETFYSPNLIVWTGICKAETNLFVSKNAYLIPNKDGWTWIAQLKDKSFYWTRLSSKKEIDLSAPPELSNSTEIIVNKIANMRWRIFRPLCVEGGILCGDAAWLIDPAAGQGILNALSSGIKAGQTAVGCIKSPQIESFILAEYDNWSFSNFEHKVKQLKEYYSIEDINVMTKRMCDD